MANFFEQIRKVNELKKQAKEMQRKLEATVAEFENAGVKVVARGDMTLVSVSITDPSVIDPAHPEKLERTMLENANKALRKVKAAAEELSKAAMKNMDLGGLGSMFG